MSRQRHPRTRRPPAPAATAAPVPPPPPESSSKIVALRRLAVFPAFIAASFLYVLLGPYSNFAAQGYLDPWIYTGYFMHLPYLIRASGATYYVSRLPWILPGLLVFKVASPAAASVILNALLISICALSLYFIVSWYYGKWPAFISAVALATNPYFMYSVSWDYPDGPAIAYAFIALAFLLRPTRGRIPNTFFAGVFVAFSGYTNMAGLPMLLALMAIPLWQRRHSFTQTRTAALWGLAGGVAATAFLAPFGKILFGRFDFYNPQLDQIRYVHDHPGYLEHMWGTGYAWVPLAYRLAPFLLAAVLGGTLLLHKRKRSAAFLPVYLAVMVGFVLFIIGEFVFHNVGLRVPYGSTYLLAPLFAFSGLVMGECWPGESAAAKKSLMAALGVALALFGLALPFWYASRPPIAAVPQKIWTIIAALIVAAVFAVLAPTRRKPALCLLPCGLILVGLSLGPASDASLSYPFQRRNAAVFDDIVRVGRLVDSNLASDRIIRFWYSGSGPAGPLFDSISSLYLWGYADCSARIAKDPVKDLGSIFGANTTFVHLTVDPSDFADRERILSARGIVTGNKRRWDVATSSGTVYMRMEDVEDLSALH